ncbi:MAG: MBL fold metallo-hydrolase [Candidatus Omnitrophica bacterium]|nr:MBL fold metallo-hydrolase [Candidatus Omnitrophota bacterium]
MILEVVRVGELLVNCYVLASSGNCGAVIIDPGDDEDKIRAALNKHGLKPALVVNTHGHFDHIGCDDRFGVPVLIHSRDVFLLKDPGANLPFELPRQISVNAEIRAVEDGEIIDSDGVRLEVIHVPGHTPGGIALRLISSKENILFSGDSLFRNSIGRADFPGADEETLISSIKSKLLVLPSDTVVYPGHGPSSTIKHEKENNPFLIQG